MAKLSQLEKVLEHLMFERRILDETIQRLRDAQQAAVKPKKVRPAKPRIVEAG